MRSFFEMSEYAAADPVPKAKLENTNAVGYEKKPGIGIQVMLATTHKFATYWTIRISMRHVSD